MKERQHEDPGDKEVREESELMKKVVEAAMAKSLSLIGKELKSVAKDHDACMKGSKNADGKMDCLSELIWRMDKVSDMRHQAVQATTLQNTVLISDARNLIGEMLSAMVGPEGEGTAKKGPGKEKGPVSMYG